MFSQIMKTAFLKVVFLFIFIGTISIIIVFNVHSKHENVPSELNNNNKNLLSQEIVEQEIADTQELPKGEPIEISEAPIFALNKAKYGQVFYNDQGIKREVKYKGEWVHSFQISPLQDKLGFYTSAESSIITDVSLIIMDITKKDFEEVYKGSSRTSDWEWFDDDNVLVYYNCGTECKALYKIDVNTGEKIDISKNFGYGVGYQWSPDKNFVLAYHYTVEYGILVGDKRGNIVFQLLRDSTPYLKIFDVKALWSPDSTKIALMIKKEDKEILEMVVFSVEQDFKQIFRENLIGEAQDIEFFWQNEGQRLVYKDLNSERKKTF